MKRVKITSQERPRSRTRSEYYSRYGTFFFSSRRRHTRFDCDWSSDVCSSDLSESRTSTRTEWGSVSGNWWVTTLLDVQFVSHRPSPSKSQRIWRTFAGSSRSELPDALKTIGVYTSASRASTWNEAMGQVFEGLIGTASGYRSTYGLPVPKMPKASSSIPSGSTHKSWRVPLHRSSPVTCDQ